MIRITDQYFWSVVFGVFFLVLITMGAIILDSEARLPLAEYALFDFVLVTLATWRLTRLFVYDEITRFVREQFFDVVKAGKKHELARPKAGPRRVLAELISCPWCVSVWMGACVIFVYSLTAYAYYPVLILAISAAASWLQLTSNLIGNHAERVRREMAD